VTFAIPAELQAEHAIISGYITLSPSAEEQAAAAQPVQLPPASPIELSVPYQGSTKDYSTIGRNNSLVLFAPVLSDVDAAAAEILAKYPEIYVCHGPSEVGCQYQPGDASEVHAAIPASGAAGDVDNNRQSGFNRSHSRGSVQAAQMAIRFGASLLRPVRDVKVQVWTSDGSSWLGTSDSLGPAANTAPWKRTYLTEGAWDGTYKPAVARRITGAPSSSALPQRSSRANAAEARRSRSSITAGSRRSRNNRSRSEQEMLHAQDNDEVVHADVADHQGVNGWQQLAVGQSYSLRLELHPVLAAGDKAAGRMLQAPFVYHVAGQVQVVTRLSRAAAARHLLH